MRMDILEIYPRGEIDLNGERFITTLADRLTTEYDRGFSAKSLRHMIRFAEGPI